MNEEVVYVKDYCLDIIPALESSKESITFYFDSKEELLAAEKSCSYLLLFLQDDLGVMENYSNILTTSQWNEGCGDYCELEEDEDYE